MTLDREAGHYDTDNSLIQFLKHCRNSASRIKVYVDFKRKVLCGDVESRITLPMDRK